MSFRQDFIRFALEAKVLCFGEFKTKSGRISPYFFNSGLFSDGDALRKLGQFYAKAIVAAGVEFDTLFGPAYKGIPLAAASAIAFAEIGRKVPFCFNRKEAKDHGEGGTTIGAPIAGRVLIVDDVITAGTSVRESVLLIRAGGAQPCGVVIALDRMERGAGSQSAAQEVRGQFGIPVVAIATLDDITEYLRHSGNMVQQLRSLEQYRQRYGVST